MIVSNPVKIGGACIDGRNENKLSELSKAPSTEKILMHRQKGQRVHACV